MTFLTLGIKLSISAQGGLVGQVTQKRDFDSDAARIIVGHHEGSGIDRIWAVARQKLLHSVDIPQSDWQVGELIISACAASTVLIASIRLAP
jgi:hypothetical protein